jgi:hypothetical protein
MCTKHGGGKDGNFAPEIFLDSRKFKGEVPVPACFSCYARLRDADVFDPDEDARFAVVGGRLLLHLDKQHQLWEYEQNGDRWVQLAESTGNRTLAHIETTDEFMYSVVPVGDERIALISNGLVTEIVLGEGTADLQPRPSHLLADGRDDSLDDMLPAGVEALSTPFVRCDFLFDSIELESAP